MFLFGSARKRAVDIQTQTFLKRDLPMKDDIVAEGEEPHAGDIHEDSGVVDKAQSDLALKQGHGMQTRSKHRKANHRANHVAVKPLSLGNFLADTAAHEL